jgi:hypothetical protein
MVPTINAAAHRVILRRKIFPKNDPPQPSFPAKEKAGAKALHFGKGWAWR